VAALRYRPFRKVIAVSGAVADVLRGAGVDDDRLVIIRDSVDAARFAQAPDCTEFRREFGVPDGALVIGAAGQLIARKGHRFLLQAMARLRASHPDARLVLFGDGELADELHRQSDSLGLGETVRFAGFRHNLDDFYGCFDIFVHPALAEGLGVAALKASAAGVPVVAFRAGGLVEAVAGGETGLLVEPGDADALSEAIISLLDDEARRSRLGKAGRDRMQSDFSIATMAREHVRLYESVIHA
jgi:glycosyltransferase involved in cell wall biosynthesis